jgi:diaminopimelate decarboxylase
MTLQNPHLLRGAHGALGLEDVPLADIAAQYGTPVYVYSQRTITENFLAYARALAGRPHQICYAMKANSNLSILKLLAGLGAGFDIVSGGELARVLAIKADPKKVVFSGVGKSHAEIETALAAGIGCFNIESTTELDRIAQIAAAHGVRAPVSFRVNPDVDPKTHPYISTGLKGNKFGVAFETALALYRKAADAASIAVRGIDCHIGSQIVDPAPYMEALDKMLDVVEALEKDGIAIHHFDLGGGLGITYKDEVLPSVDAFLQPILKRFGERGHAHRTFMLEPGRSITGNAGLLLSKVEVLKPGATKNFCIVDAAMNDYMRPALYQSYSEIVEVAPQGQAVLYDVVGPVCESGDWLGRDRALAVQEGDLVALLSAGAYGMSMASNYNTRNRVAEVMVNGSETKLIRARETLEAQLATEMVCLKS